MQGGSLRRSFVAGTLAIGVALVGCDDPTLTDDGSGSSSSSTGAGAPCEEKIIYGAGQRVGLASYGESVVYVRLTEEFLPPSIVVSDLLTGEDRVLVEDDKLGQYVVFDEDLYLLLGDQLRTMRLDGSGDALIATIDPGKTVVEMVAESGGVTWLEQEEQGASKTVRRWRNGVTTDYPGQFGNLTPSDTGGIIANNNGEYLARIDENGVTPLTGVGHPFLVRDGLLYVFRQLLEEDVLVSHYTRIDLGTGDTSPLFEADAYIFYSQLGVGDATGFLTPATAPNNEAERLMRMPYDGGEPTILLQAPAQQHFNGAAQTEKYIVVSVEGPASQIRAICRDTLPL
jgi:hypothetical protein